MSNETARRHDPEDILHLLLNWERFLQPMANRHQPLSFASFLCFHPSLNLILTRSVIRL